MNDEDDDDDNRIKHNRRYYYACVKKIIKISKPDNMRHKNHSMTTCNRLNITYIMKMIKNNTLNHTK